MSGNASARARQRAHLTAAGVHVERGGRPVLTDVSVSVGAGTRLGIVGENGRGKSTLLQVLSGALVPDQGTVQRSGSLGVADQEITVDLHRTVGELIDRELTEVRAALRTLDEATTELAAGVGGADEAYARALEVATALDVWDADRRVEMALEALSAITDRNRMLSTLSVGQRYRVRLACLLGAGHDFLLLDEPTNHLDHDGLDFLTDALRTTAAGVVLVSHDRRLLADVATKILDLDPSRDGRPRLYGDGYAGYRAGRDAELARWNQEWDRHRAEQAQLADDLSAAQNRLQGAWRPPKGTGKHQRATRAPSLVRAVHRRLEDLAAHDVSRPVAPVQFQMPDLPALPGVTLVGAVGVAVDGRLPTPVSLALGSGDRLLVTGPNGAGKSTLLSVLAGHLRPDHGAVTRASTARVGLVAQESPSADERTAGDVYENRLHELRAAGLRDDQLVPVRALGLLRSTELSRPVQALSMGQQRRLDLALALAGRPHLLLLDEPTNHLSIALVDELTGAFEATPAALVVVTHDRQMRQDLAHWPTVELERTYESRSGPRPRAAPAAPEGLRPRPRPG
jgi:macrolide transport system ATP-binding/permease protein